jgi:hypothetical protein
MGLTTAEIKALESIQATMESIREEYAGKRKQRSKARLSTYMIRDN